MPTNLIAYLPGYTGLPPAKYNPLLKRFRDAGYDTISVNYTYFGRGSIANTAKRTNRVLEPLRQHYEHITLVGHSMGGLVARKALIDNPQVSDSLVTLGSPHRGVQAAIRPFWWLGGKSVKEMGRTSKFLADLDLAHILEDIPTLTISGQRDLIVKDASMNVIDPAIKHIEVPTTHLGLILSPRVYGEIAAWLTYDILDSVGFNGKGRDLNERHGI